MGYQTGLEWSEGCIGPLVSLLLRPLLPLTVFYIVYHFVWAGLFSFNYSSVAILIALIPTTLVALWKWFPGLLRMLFDIVQTDGVRGLFAIKTSDLGGFSAYLPSALISLFVVILVIVLWQ